MSLTRKWEKSRASIGGCGVDETGSGLQGAEAVPEVESAFSSCCDTVGYLRLQNQTLEPRVSKLSLLKDKTPSPPESWLRCLRSFGDLDDTGTCLLLWHVLRSLKGPSVGQRCALSLQGLGLALLWPGSPPLSSNRAVAGHLVTMAPCPSVPLPPSYFIFLEHCPPPPCWECFMSVITYICSSSSTDPRLPGGKGSVVLVAVTPLSPERSLAQTTFVGR